MAYVLPGLEGIDFKDAMKAGIVEYGENDAIIKCMVARAVAIALEEKDGAYVDESSWTTYLPTVAKLSEEDLEAKKDCGGFFYLTTLCVLHFMFIENKRPESFLHIVEHIRSWAASEEVGDMLAIPFTRHGFDGSFFETFFRTFLKSLDQTKNAEKVAEATKKVYEEYGPEFEEVTGVPDFVLDEYEYCVSSEEGIRDYINEALEFIMGYLPYEFEGIRHGSEYWYLDKLINAEEGSTLACFGGNMTNCFHSGASVSYCEDRRIVACNQLKAQLETRSSDNGSKYVCARPLDVIGNERFDRIAWDFPLGCRTSALEGESAALGRCKQGLPEYGRALSADWTYARLAMESLSEGGRAVLRVSDGALMNGADARIRKHFIDNGWIEGVVSLKKTDGIKSSLLVLSRGNKGVRFVQDRIDESALEEAYEENDVHKYYEAETTGVFELYEQCTKASYDGGWELYGERLAIYIPNEKIDHDTLLNVDHYLQAELLLENPVALADVAEEIRRGTSMQSWELVEVTTTESSPIRYLALKDICDGRIAGQPLSINEEYLEDKELKHCAINGDVLISRSEPMTIMVADLAQDEKLLVNGNMFIVRFDKEYMNPYYAAAFLASRLGQEVVRRLRVGTKQKTLPRKMLSKIQIPMLPMEEQERIATEYQAKLDEIEILNLRIERVREEILMSFSEGR